MNAARRSSMIAAALLCMLSVSATRNSATKTHAFLLVANKADRSVSIVDPEAGREVAAVPVGGITVHEVAASPDGSLAWAPIYGNSGVGRSGTDGQTLSVIDLKTRKIVDTIDFQKTHASALRRLRTKRRQALRNSRADEIDRRDRSHVPQDHRIHPNRRARVAHARNLKRREEGIHL